MNSKKLAALVALSLSAGLAGCAAQTDAADDESQDEAITAPADESNAVANDEKTGEAADKCGFGGFGGFGWGGFGWGGFGWGGFGGCGGFGWGGFGWGGFGGCGGFGWGGFGGCGCGGFGGWGGGFGGCW
jgi:hypothetical protein